jgi:hypothetical protein
MVKESISYLSSIFASVKNLIIDEEKRTADEEISGTFSPQRTMCKNVRI